MASRTDKPWWQQPHRLIMIGLVVVAAYLLVTDRKEHAFGIMPYLLLVACPLMHLMHRGQGGHQGHSRHGDGSER